jgi:DNA-binding transcriptional LysR family regulator
MNFRTLDLNLLRVFDRVMAEGSLTRAAAELAMTQPAASHALKRLHAAVGEPLFVRSAFGMKPTARAEALWPQVRDALASLRQALAPEHFDPRADNAVFRLTMADATAALLSPPLLNALQAEAARVSVRLQPLTTRDPRRLLLEGERRPCHRPLSGRCRRPAGRRPGLGPAPAAPVRQPLRGASCAAAIRWRSGRSRWRTTAPPTTCWSASRAGRMA